MVIMASPDLADHQFIRINEVLIYVYNHDASTGFIANYPERPFLVWS
jgi:hypothetical protein